MVKLICLILSQTFALFTSGRLEFLMAVGDVRSHTYVISQTAEGCGEFRKNK